MKEGISSFRLGVLCSNKRGIFLFFCSNGIKGPPPWLRVTNSLISLPQEKVILLRCLKESILGFLVTLRPLFPVLFLLTFSSPEGHFTLYSKEPNRQGKSHSTGTKPRVRKDSYSKHLSLKLFNNQKVTALRLRLTSP